ncbi:MAG: PLP-dependent aminotransferase family protein [Rhizobiales bacterium]|nr:PLP-dependent aminotransferase family protein [Hyphomicrobiales bacterium]NRB14054.1 PLP-dependent aminotransferase family protein [Hyphomicrobiales bacterium]
MPNSTAFDADILLNLAASPANLPKWRKIYLHLKTSILNGSLKADIRLPASRNLAQQLGLSRNTVTTALDQLIAEGYLVAKPGSGTYVANIQPDQTLFNTPKRATATTQNNQNHLGLSERGLNMSQIKRPNFSSTSRYIPFQSGMPDLSQFPRQEFAKILSQVTKSIKPDQLDYDYNGGLPTFKHAIASYLGASRGVICDAEQVLIVSGSQAGLDLIARLMIDIGDDIWFEHPGYGGAHSVFSNAGANFHALPIINDEHHFQAAIKTCPQPKLAYVTPSHQHPTGTTMSLKHRQTLLQLAQDRNFWLIEDDYDSEYRYDGRPIAALQGLDSNNRTIYVGTFSKILSPSLRCAYIILPHKLVEAFTRAAFNAGIIVPTIMQLALTQFINNGQFMAHIRKMRVLYSQRREVILSAIDTHLSAYIKPLQTNAGMHFAVRLTHPKLQNLGDEYICQHLQNHNISARALSAYALQPLDVKQQGLLLGFAPFKSQQLIDAAQKMAVIFAKLTA